MTPQRSDRTILYRAVDDRLVVDIDGIVDVFDFTGASDGTFSDFDSDTLPICPVISATKSIDTITVKVINAYGPKPTQVDGESEKSYTARQEAWLQNRNEYEVEL